MFSSEKRSELYPDGDLVSLGRVLGARGVRGEVSVELFCDYVERFVEAGRVFALLAAGRRELHVTEARSLGKVAGVSFAEVIDRTQAEELAGAHLAIPRDEVPPAPEGSFRHFELLGMEVYTTSGELLGELVDIFPTGSNDVYVVESGSKEYLIPATEEVVKKVDRSERKMIIEPIPGLLEP